MRGLVRLLPFVLWSLPAFPQSPGIAPAWDVRVTIDSLVKQTQRYLDVVQSLRTDQWLAAGAPQAYVQQRQTVLSEIGSLKIVGTRLAENPEKLSLALDAYFRLQNLETFTIALSEGAARYQAGDASAALNSLLTENAVTRAKLRQYVVDLTANKEQEHAAAEREAQRCMSVISRPAASPSPARPANRQEKK